MEFEVLHDEKKKKNHLSAGYQNPNIDTSRPFRSVKEAVEIFGEKFLAKEIYSPKPFNFPNQETPNCFYTPSPSPQKSQSETSVFDSNSNDDDLKMGEALKKLQQELEVTKMELRLLKERESETEVALASLNAELHKNMSKLARAEADAASNALASRWEKNSSRTFAQVLSVGEENDGLQLFEGKNMKENEKKKKKKKKPIIPLVGDFFWKKKGSATTMQNPLFASHLSLN